MLNSFRNLSLEKDSQPDYVWFELKAEDEEFCFPPTTHFIATVEDLTDTLDYGSEDIDGMEDDAGEEQELVPTGHWSSTSSHDIYMWIHPKKTMMRNGRRQRRMTPPRSKQSVGVGAAPNPASAKQR